MDLSQTKAKVTIAKLLELAYSKDEGLTAKIMAQKEGVKLTVDQNGNVTLSGSVGMLTFDGTPVLTKIGAKISRISVKFSDKGGMKIGYEATYSLEVISLTVSGVFDLEELITSCSGWLCQAARAMKGREMELQRIMESNE